MKFVLLNSLNRLTGKNGGKHANGQMTFVVSGLLIRCLVVLSAICELYLLAVNRYTIDDAIDESFTMRLKRCTIPWNIVLCHL